LRVARSTQLSRAGHAPYGTATLEPNEVLDLEKLANTDADRGERSLGGIRNTARVPDAGNAARERLGIPALQVRLAGYFKLCGKAVRAIGGRRPARSELFR